MPSCTVPMFSNSEAISHITQCEMPFSRSAIAVAAATAPTPTWPRVHSHSATPAVPTISSHAQRVVDDLEAAHQAHLAVDGHQELRASRERAKPASRCACENSLTVAMLV